MAPRNDWHQLCLHQARTEDVYKDTARIHEGKRSGVKSGRIVRLYVKGAKSVLVAVRGLDCGEESWIRLDEVTRERLGIADRKLYSVIEVRIRKGHWWESVSWALTASDPAARVSILIATFLGAISIVVSILGLPWDSIHKSPVTSPAPPPAGSLPFSPSKHSKGLQGSRQSDLR